MQAFTPPQAPVPGASDMSASDGMATVQAWLQEALEGRTEVPVLMDRANRLNELGASPVAAQLYAAWLTQGIASPLIHVVLFNYGTVLGQLKQHALAEQVYRQALQTHPGFIQARLNLGHQLEQQGKGDEALKEWGEAISQLRSQPQQLELNPELFLHAQNNSARLLETLRRFPEAEAMMRESLLFKARQSDVLQHYVHLRQKQCEWPLYQPFGEVTVHHLMMGTSALAMLSVSDEPAMQLLAAQKYVNERVPKAQETPLHALRPPRTGKVKVGFLSGDLAMHAVGLLSVEMFELFDRERFELHAFSWSKEDGTPLRARIKAAFEHYHPLHGTTEAEAARQIADAGVDVLVDLQGLTNGARPGILGHRPAPIQVGYLGLPATSALPGVDWILADDFVLPPEMEPYYTEKPIRLAGCYQVSDRQRPMAQVPTRAQCGLPEQGFVYCSFNNNFKFTEPVFASWMRILKSVPGSVLWLLADNAWAQENMLRQADLQGVARERLIFAPRVMPHEYVARFGAADLFLDTFPYNAGTTANDVLFAGTPLLTRSGKTYISRMAGSLLTAVGLPDLICDTPEEYEARAIQLGRNPLRIESYKRYLREQGRQSRLFDVPAIVRSMEDEFGRLALAQREREARSGGMPG